MVVKIKLIPYLLQINEFYVNNLNLDLDNLPEFVEEFLEQYEFVNEKSGDYLSCQEIIKDNIKVGDETFELIAGLIHRGEFGQEKDIINIRTNKKTGKNVKEDETVPNNFYLFFMPIDDDKIYFMASRYKTWGIAENTVRQFNKFIREKYYEKENNLVKPIDEILGIRTESIKADIRKKKKRNNKEPQPIKIIKFTSIDIIQQIKCIEEINIYHISKNQDLADELIKSLPSNNDNKPKYKLQSIDKLILKIYEPDHIQKTIDKFKTIFGLDGDSNPIYKEKDIEFIKLKTKLKSDEEKIIRISPDGIIFREDYIYEFKDPNDLKKVIDELKNDELFNSSLNEALSKRQN
ncbi:hypothetical protein JH146_0860 [Methanocaldococcus bathoardescens]|uniref:Uncharacterized protein n=1 Tax=Methanocaldococcus bathoardescens TaxID=1301915 RepID=A0A076LBF5_9EURY|nr:hypothetical protein [Methanocaldococcus bathoardescens]AIJ05705.1 hypothetical protein JH146_0860 [Methanocaldococcus bathoardescens]